jgi:hypothetical protein
MSEWIPTPAQEMQRIEAVFIAMKWRCAFCSGRATVEWNGIVNEYVCPYIVEHAHDPDCHLHDDNLEAVENHG